MILFWILLFGCCIGYLLRLHHRWGAAERIVQHARTMLENGHNPISVESELAAAAQLRGIEDEVDALWASEMEEWEERAEKVNEL